MPADQFTEATEPLVCVFSNVEDPLEPCDELPHLIVDERTDVVEVTIYDHDGGATSHGFAALNAALELLCGDGLADDDTWETGRAKLVRACARAAALDAFGPYAVED